MSIFVCPVPLVWHKAYQRLFRAWKASGNNGSPPPRPLILAGWNFSGDSEKKDRWEGTVLWAKEHELAELIPQLTPDKEYRVDVLQEYSEIEFGEQFFEPRTKPKSEEVIEALEKLKDDWENVAGSELAAVTYPIRFTGKKRRRLTIATDESFKPQWGSWQSVSLGGRRSSFSRFRAAVNEAIAPHSVDHIDFVPRSADDIRRARS